MPIPAHRKGRDVSAVLVPPPTEDLVETVLRRMDEGGGFPALTQAVSQIVEALDAGVDDPAVLAGVVLQDLSLTQKVLRLANSAMYAPIGKNIATVSHALLVLGYEAVGFLALGVRLISSLENGAPGPVAERALGRSILAGSVASALTRQVPIDNGEEGVVCTLMHRLGHLLAVFYLPEAHARIETLGRQLGDPEAAARAVLGLDYEALGQQVATRWNMPAKIIGSMDSRADPATLGLDPRLVALTRFSNQAAAVMTTQDADAQPIQLAGLAERYCPVLSVDSALLLGAVREAVDAATAQPMLASLLHEPAAVPATVPVDILEELRQALAAGMPSGQLVAMSLERLFTSLGLQRVALFLREPAEPVYRVRASLSARATNPLQDVSVPSTFSPDLVHVVLSKQADIYIDNPRDTKIAHRLPGWISRHGLQPFFILSLVRERRTLGFLYGQQQDNRTLTEAELARLKALRDLLASGLGGPGEADGLVPPGNRGFQVQG